MKKNIFLMLIGMVLPLIANASTPIYQQDGKEGNWSAFHYLDKQSHHITACFALSNDLKLGFKSNAESVGLLLWDKQGGLVPKTSSKAAITVGKQHFIFNMQAMDKNMSMNRLNNVDFKNLLQALSYGQLAMLEYQKKPLSMIDLSGLPNMLARFHRCIQSANFKDYK